MAVDVVIACLVRFTDLPTGGWIFAVAMIVGGVAAFLLNGSTAAINWRHVAVIAVLLTLWAVIVTALYDTSWDGTAYHLPAILELSGGWNPLDSDGVVDRADLHPHGLWLLQQTAGDFLGSFEATKILHAMLAGTALSSLLAWWKAETGRSLGFFSHRADVFDCLEPSGDGASVDVLCGRSALSPLDDFSRGTFLSLPHKPAMPRCCRRGRWRVAHRHENYG